MKKNFIVTGIWLTFAAVGICTPATAQVGGTPVSNAYGSLDFPTRLAVGQQVPALATCRTGGTPQLQWNPPNLLTAATQQPAVPPGAPTVSRFLVGATAGTGTMTVKCSSPVGGAAIPDGPSISFVVASAPTPVTTTAPTTSAPQMTPAAKAAQEGMDAAKLLYDRMSGACKSTPGCVPK